MDNQGSVRRGDKFHHPFDGGECRVMAEADNYVMMRRPKCRPFIVPLKKLLDEWKRYDAAR